MIGPGLLGRTYDERWVCPYCGGINMEQNETCHKCRKTKRELKKAMRDMERAERREKANLWTDIWGIAKFFGGLAIFYLVAFESGLSESISSSAGISQNAVEMIIILGAIVVVNLFKK